LPALVKFLKGETLTDDEAIYPTIIRESYPDNDDVRSVALRFVIHYISDIVQPLHNTSRIDTMFPEGDQGGNLETFEPVIDGVANLHSIWDSVIYNFTGYPELPLTDEHWASLTADAADIAENYPFSEQRVMSGQFSDWSTESFELAVIFAYNGWKDDQEGPSDAYDKRAEPVIKSQIHLGARRLAETIKDIFASEVQKKELFLQ
jgi:hypothetical protein